MKIKMGFWEFMFYWTIFSIVFVASILTAVHEWQTRSFRYSTDKYNFTVYKEMPEKELNRKLGSNFSEQTAGFTDSEGKIALEANDAPNTTAFHDYCDHEVLHNLYPGMPHWMVYAKEKPADFEVCDKVTLMTVRRDWIKS